MLPVKHLRPRKKLLLSTSETAAFGVFSDYMLLQQCVWHAVLVCVALQ